MNLKDLHFILDLAQKNFVNFPIGLTVEGMNRQMDSREIMAASYYQAVIDFLVKKQVLLNTKDHDIILFEIDSDTIESDYE